MLDERGLIESSNPSAERIFGYQALEMIGRHVKELVSHSSPLEYDARIRDQSQTGDTKVIGIRREKIGRRKDGSLFPVEFVLSKMRLGDRQMYTAIIRDITKRKQLEREILEVSGHEQKRIAQELHDGLCQHLAGVTFMSKVQEEKLAVKSLPEAASAKNISDLVNKTVIESRNLARGLFPVELDGNGLVPGLEQLAGRSQKMYSLACSFRCDQPIQVQDKEAATHLYRIAQEGINNAAKHGKARQILISLSMVSDQVTLTIMDDGKGPAEKPGEKSGIGLLIMKYRAVIIGASLNLRRQPNGWTILTCSLPGTAPVQIQLKEAHEQTRSVFA